MDEQQQLTRRRFLIRGLGTAAGVAAGMYVAPSLRQMPVARAWSQGTPTPTPKPDTKDESTKKDDSKSKDDSKTRDESSKHDGSKDDSNKYDGSSKHDDGSSKSEWWKFW